MQHREKKLQHRMWSCWSKLARRGLRHNWLKLVVLSGICLLAYTHYTRLLPKKPYTTEELLGPAYSLIKNNGRMFVDDIPALSYYTDDVKYKAMKDLRHSFQELVKACATNKKPVCKSKSDEDLNGERAILTLFTTWVYDKDKFYINNNTLYNWRRLAGVKLVIFSDDVEVVRYGKQAGWTILPVTRQVTGAPILPVMFREAMATFDTHFYGYANGDLLFTESLTRTLEAILCQTVKHSKGMLVVGRRTNFPSEMIKDGAPHLDSLEKLAYEHGKLFQPDAEDYFITDKHFPWSSFLPLAVGRTGYDNWVVTYARLKNVNIIDATDTILCVHQTMESRGNYEGHTKGEYNVEMIENLNLPIPVFRWGLTSCAEMKSAYDLCNNVMIKARPAMVSECTSVSFYHKLLKVVGLANSSISL